MSRTIEEKRKTLDEWAEAEREARRATAREYYQRNKEEILKRQKERLAKMTPEERRAHNRRRYECRKKRFEVNPELKERALERMRKYYREHTEEIRERHREELCACRRELRRLKKKQSTT